MTRCTCKHLIYKAGVQRQAYGSVYWGISNLSSKRFDQGRKVYSYEAEKEGL